MILMMRVDYRLLHGQIVYSWVRHLNADCILIANDAIVNDSVNKMAMRATKPEGTKLVIKDIQNSITAINSGVTDKYRLFVIVGCVADAYKLAKACPAIKKINLGNVIGQPDYRQINKTFSVSGEEEGMLNELLDAGDEIFAQSVPSMKQTDYTK